MHSEGLADTYSYTYDTSLVYRYVLQSQTSQTHRYPDSVITSTEYGPLSPRISSRRYDGPRPIVAEAMDQESCTRTPGIMYVCTSFLKGYDHDDDVDGS